MAATTTKQSLNTNTSPFNFLKEGLLLHSHNRRLFASIFAICVASNSLFLLAYELGVQPFAFNVSHDLYTLNHTSRRTPRYTHLLRQLHDDSRSLLLANIFYLVSGLIFSSITELIAVFAAVTTRSGEAHTFATLLGRAKAQLKGPVLTVAFVYLLLIFSIALLSAMAALFVFLVLRRYLGLLLVDGLVLLVAYSLYVYVSFVCSLAVVVAVAEPGSRGGAGAVWRAWRLVKGSLGLSYPTLEGETSISHMCAKIKFHTYDRQ
ncbi:hypothetical protein HU200_063723 [Digitaria exilis]|uniref:Uncharacterized protein n=1 Tax=Digitaria exilis TaxID=1010633 RepID=A0A835DV21_9POAL|nr:hypothetical protein HU200_063723 [Digitaria exilis]